MYERRADEQRAKPETVRSTDGTKGKPELAWVARGFTWLEDVVYIGLGLLLGGSALILLVSGGVSFGRGILDGTLAQNIIDLLDQVLLILMIVEILYTVQVSFREHVLAPEPFLVIALIATTRRILILTAEFPRLLEQGESPFRSAMLELGLLTLMIVALVASLRILQKRSPAAV